jgi:UDP-N-acetylglucosamine--N-acetylmuramyl-(pentapeptide) pyrophosphoryl-undecaprenol N-acetylglucosamine transferase
MTYELRSASKTLMVMAGGTGGHVFPGLAVANHLRAQGWRVIWLGNPKGMEASLVPTHGFEMVGIQFGGLRGKGLLTKLLLPMNLLRAFAQSIGVMRRVKPDVVLGMGGYITFPAGMMAVLLGKPLVLHEQNSIAGLANKVLAKVADATLTAFPGVLPNAEWVGNPIRREILSLPSPQERYADRVGPIRVLVVGGSVGAQFLNTLLPEALALVPKEKRPVVTHQVGRGNQAAIEQRYAQLGVDAKVLEFVQDMATAYGDSDLVISRAGAMAVSEIACVGVASLLVPFPHAVDDHQTTNAAFLNGDGAAELKQQNELTAQWLAQWLTNTSRSQMQLMAEKARSKAKIDATETVARVCASWANHGPNAKSMA